VTRDYSISSPQRVTRVPALTFDQQISPTQTVDRSCWTGLRISRAKNENWRSRRGLQDRENVIACVDQQPHY